MIPEMTDPLGKHWRQPNDIRSAPMDDTHVLLSKRQLSELSGYHDTMPSGVYPGKCWKRWEKDNPRQGTKYPGKLLLVWYGIADDPKLCTIEFREIRTGALKLFPSEDRK